MALLLSPISRVLSEVASHNIPWSQSTATSSLGTWMRRGTSSSVLSCEPREPSTMECQEWAPASPHMQCPALDMSPEHVSKGGHTPCPEDILQSFVTISAQIKIYSLLPSIDKTQLKVILSTQLKIHGCAWSVLGVAASDSHPYWKHCPVMCAARAAGIKGLLHHPVKTQIFPSAKMLARGYLKSQSYTNICDLPIFFIPNLQGWNLLPRDQCLFLLFPKMNLWAKYIPQSEWNSSRCI